jgi:16S rRNA processing protein RimM
MDLVPVARIVKPRGVRGEVWVERYWADFPDFEPGSRFWLLGKGAGREVAAAHFFEYAKGCVLKLEGVRTPEEALQLAGLELALPGDQVPEEGPGEFDTLDVVGWRVVDRARGEIGTVERVREGAAYWTFEAAGPRGVFEVPAVAGLGVELSKEAKVLRVDLPPGYPDVDEDEDRPHED